MATVAEARMVKSLMRNSGFTIDTDPTPMLGLQASQKTLRFGFSEGNRRVPHRDDIPEILCAVEEEVFPTLHYYTKEPALLVSELDTLLSIRSIYDRGLVGGVQINKVWPTPEQVSEIRSRFPKLKITLQMSSSVTGGMTGEQVADRLAKEYADVEYIILDQSGGKGIEFDMSESVSAYLTFRARGVKSNIVIAGGLDGSNVRRKITAIQSGVDSLDFSIDAEGGLRDRVGEGYGNDVLNPAYVQSYLEGASERFLPQKRG
ncbi:MAG: hypothetical protein KGH57_01025 [Candidatus Micrarchaeota archaeon]|nr:hypothetical protein [Candidatus Micrarchaeota archaeon]